MKTYNLIKKVLYSILVLSIYMLYAYFQIWYWFIVEDVNKGAEVVVFFLLNVILLIKLLTELDEFIISLIKNK
jgi:hypothetical protein